MAVGVDNDSLIGEENAPMEMGSSGFGEDSALYPHPGRAVGASPAAIPVPRGQGQGTFPWAFAPVQGEVHRKAQQQPGPHTGTQVLGQVWIWNGPNQSKGVGIAQGISVRGNNLHHLTLQ